MTPRRKKLLVIAASAYLILALTGGLIKLIDLRNDERACKFWQSQAMTSGATTYEKARTWLKSNGFRITFFNARQESTGEPLYQVVIGQRMLHQACRPLRQASWLDL